MAGDGRNALRPFPVFAQAFDEVDAMLDGHLRSRLRDVMWGDDAELLDNTEFRSAVNICCRSGISSVAAAWGVVPDMVLGHSVGEITAAYVAGVLSLADAAHIIVGRGRLMASLPAGGVMVAVAGERKRGGSIAYRRSGDCGDQRPECGRDFRCRSPGGRAGGSVGATGQTGTPVDGLARRSFGADRPNADQFSQLVTELTPGRPRIGWCPAFWAVGRAWIWDGAYWVEHVRQPVRFVDGVRRRSRWGPGSLSKLAPRSG